MSKILICLLYTSDSAAGSGGCGGYGMLQDRHGGSRRTHGEQRLCGRRRQRQVGVGRDLPAGGLYREDVYKRQDPVLFIHLCVRECASIVKDRLMGNM